MLSRSVELFGKNFIDCSKGDRKTVLYGLGKWTEEILAAFPQFPVEGLLDGYCEDGEFCGKRIIALDSLAGQNVQIVILARKASERIIYKRIGSFCSKQKIPVYGLDGILLGGIKSESENNGITEDEYFFRNSEELKNRIRKYDAISFDVFDTLVIRKVMRQEKVLSMVKAQTEPNFDYIRLRMKAEIELSRKGVPTIYDIYEWIGRQSMAEQEILSELIEKELKTEKAILEPRKVMVRLLKEALSMGKPVYLVSDMYLPRIVIEELLDGAGISGYDNLFVSCDYRANKAGDLYDIYKANSTGKKKLHIGDSKELDGECAVAHGLDVYLIKSPEEMAGLTVFGSKLMEADNNDGLQGIIFARFFNSPFVLYQGAGKLRAAVPSDLGYGLLGPILTAYVEWLYEKLMEDPADIMLFIARDGYVVKQIFDIMKSSVKYEKFPESHYIMISRNFSMLASLETDADILYASALPFNGNPDEMLKRRFQLKETEVRSYQSGEDKAGYLMSHKRLILEKAASVRAAYRKYLFPLKLAEKWTGIFDFASTGTCQMCMEKIMDISLKGYYFERVEDNYPDKQKLHIHDFVHDQFVDYESNNYFLLESWMKSVDPSVKCITDEGKVLYCEQHNSEEQKKYICQIQQGALEFCRDYLKLTERGMGNECIREFASHILPMVNEEFICLEDAQPGNYDEFSNRYIKL